MAATACSRASAPLLANLTPMAWSDRGRMAALVRVKRMAVGIVFPADFSMLWTLPDLTRSHFANGGVRCLQTTVGI